MALGQPHPSCHRNVRSTPAPDTVLQVRQFVLETLNAALFPGVSSSGESSDDDSDFDKRLAKLPTSSSTSLDLPDGSSTDGIAESEFRNEEQGMERNGLEGSGSIMIGSSDGMILLLERAFTKGHSVGNAAVKLKTLRMASNVSLSRVQEARRRSQFWTRLFVFPQIVLLVTKAVGDLLGTDGIADEMIKFNGFPFLEKEDHAYGVDVSAVMRTDLYTVPEKGLRVKDYSFDQFFLTTESLISSTDVKGFPVVSVVASGSDSSLSSSWSEVVTAVEGDGGKPVLLGYIGKTELKFVLDKFRKTAGHLDPKTACLFGSPLPPPPPSAPVSASDTFFSPTPGTGNAQFGSLDAERSVGIV
ncbi:hypothetical protein DFJ43DRAFT_1156806 [Lentinula guzmanii]|uniref:Uncharacterized protein n=1 Tax=Lentinula guzmanii TaxID=2804957 RepID=A0AA38JMW1_9AGAR|nr:hypothetical protein DFJ43DRAFT_1156806 [Lentinula guzmanii]